MPSRRCYDAVRLSKQHKQILLILARGYPRVLRLAEITRPIEELRRRKFFSDEISKYPKRRVITASCCRGLKTLHERGLISNESKAGFPRWLLTAEGLATTRRIRLELQSQISKLSDFELFM